MGTKVERHHKFSNAVTKVGLENNDELHEKAVGVPIINVFGIA